MPDASKLELQFHFADDSHMMDAIVRNENEKELLAILKAIISAFGFSITINSEGLVQRDAFKQNWALAGDNASQINAVLTLISLFISAKPKRELSAEIAVKNEVKTEKGIEVQKKKARLDKAKKELREIEKLHPDTVKELIITLESNPRLIWHRSNFFKKISLYQRIERFSTSLLDDSHVPTGSEKMVVRKNFNSFIVNSNEFPPNVDEEAIVEIVAPVLTTAKSKWKGIYKGASISFDIKDEEFKKSVFSQMIEFKNGVAIKCVLQLVQRIDGRGVVKTKSMTVLNVLGVINPNGPLTGLSTRITRTPLAQEEKIQISAGLVAEPVSAAALQKKNPRVDNRQLDMFA